MMITDIAEEIEVKQGPETASTYFAVATSVEPVLQEIARRLLEEVNSEVAGQILGLDLSGAHPLAATPQHARSRRCAADSGLRQHASHEYTSDLRLQPSP
jgi:hypothetical protein